MARAPRYGHPNLELIGGWIGLAPEDDGPFWAVNLMKYRPVADYGDGRASALSGREADDAYTPRASLAAIGARIAFAADVARQLAGHPAWDRIGIVRYPSRGAFLAMQRREDFKRQHVHKEAGMECTIVMSCLPDAERPPRPGESTGSLVMRVLRFAPGTSARAEDVDGAHRMLTFAVEGVILGDDRRWDEVRFDVARDDAAIAALQGPAAGVDDSIVMVLRPFVDELVATVLERR